MLKGVGEHWPTQRSQGESADQQVFTASSGNYTTHIACFLDVLKVENVILCRTSALD